MSAWQAGAVSQGRVGGWAGPPHCHPCAHALGGVTPCITLACSAMLCHDVPRHAMPSPCCVTMRGPSTLHAIAMPLPATPRHAGAGYELLRYVSHIHALPSGPPDVLLVDDLHALAGGASLGAVPAQRACCGGPCCRASAHPRMLCSNRLLCRKPSLMLDPTFQRAMPH